jgi:hypothetical protein
VYARLQVERNKSNCVNEFLNHGGNHHGPKANRITRDNNKANLPGQSYANKPVIKTRVRDWRRILTPDDVENEVQGRKLDEAKNPRDKEDDFREFHLLAADGQAVDANGWGRHRAAKFQIISYFRDIHEHFFQVTGHGDLLYRIG